MIFLCIECDSLFDEDDARLVAEIDEPSYLVCPHCGDAEWEVARECDVCTEYFPNEALTEDMCDACFAEVTAEL